MPRPIKRGLDSFPLDVDIFSDEKVVCITEAYGAKGEATLIRLLCAIYHNGYFIEWDGTTCLNLHIDMKGVSKGLIRDIVSMLVKVGFFDSDIFNEHSVLTSTAIQKRYFSIIRRNRSVISGDTPYLLIPSEKTPKAKASRQKPILDVEQPSYGITPPDNRSIESKVAEIKQEDAWLNQMQMVFHMPMDEIRKCLDEFIPFCHAYAYDHSRDSVGELKRHFCNWMWRKPKSESTTQPPKASDYTFNGGFGGIDT